MLDSLKPNLFSGMQGKVIKDGKPVSGAMITLNIEYFHVGSFQRQTTSDENGEFYLAPLRAFALRAYIPIVQPVIKQRIDVVSGEVRKNCWRHSKGIPWGVTENGDFEGKGESPIKVVFDLSESEGKVQKVGTATIGGACTLLNPFKDEIEVQYVD